MTTKTGDGAPFSEESDADAPMQLDPMGGNVGLQNAYPDDTAPPETESCLLCDSSGIPLMTNDDTPRARDGSRMKFAFEGISVPWAIASSILENSGGMMKKIENNARTTFLGYIVKTQRGRELQFDNWEDARTAAVRTETYQAYAVYSWDINWGSLSFERQEIEMLRKLAPEEVSSLRTNVQKLLNDGGTGNGSCAVWIEKLLNVANAYAKDNKINSDNLFQADVMKLFDHVNAGDGFSFGSVGWSTISGGINNRPNNTKIILDV